MKIFCSEYSSELLKKNIYKSIKKWIHFVICREIINFATKIKLSNK